MALDPDRFDEAPHATLSQRIRSRTARVAVIGMGYVGSQLALAQAEAGYHVLGIEVDPVRLTQLKLATDLSSRIAGGSLQLTNDVQALSTADVIAICVGTPLSRNHEPDVGPLCSAAAAVGSTLHPGQLVIVESTVYPGATEELVRGILDDRGLVCGEDYFLAYAPERVDPGNQRYRFRNTPKLVAGVTPEAGSLAKAFYSSAVEQVLEVSEPRIAEMAKLYENAYRAVNISFVNEMMLLCHHMGIDVWEVLSAAESKPFGIQIFQPGPGIGGHCIPVDPFYLSWKAREYGFQIGFIEQVARVNWQVARHVVQQVSTALSDSGKSLRNAKLLVLGVAYKADVADVRESAALRILPELRKLGAQVRYHDPLVAELEVDGEHLRSVDLTPDALASSDCVLVLTDHSGVDYEAVVRYAPLVYDTRNATRLQLPSPNVLRL
ncbi:MAG: nucleotide sugar dehydrogenase [Thermaerobacter sp.]|nr:nucleotide sugar dehydrogenase [Thermaerobacter sp.]